MAQTNKRVKTLNLWKCLLYNLLHPPYQVGKLTDHFDRSSHCCKNSQFHNSHRFHSCLKIHSFNDHVYERRANSRAFWSLYLCFFYYEHLYLSSDEFLLRLFLTYVGNLEVNSLKPWARRSLDIGEIHNRNRCTHMKRDKIFILYEKWSRLLVTE